MEAALWGPNADGLDTSCAGKSAGQALLADTADNSTTAEPLIS